MNEVLTRTTSMKGVRNAINDYYDKQKVQIIYILKRQGEVVKEKSLLVLTNCTGGDEEIENTEEKTKIVTMKITITKMALVLAPII